MTDRALSATDEFVFDNTASSEADGWFALPEIDDEVQVGLLLPAVTQVPEARSSWEPSPFTVLTFNENPADWPDSAGDPVPRYDFIDCWPVV